jgi:hypothetical protein
MTAIVNGHSSNAEKEQHHQPTTQVKQRGTKSPAVHNQTEKHQQRKPTHVISHRYFTISYDMFT